MQSPPKRSNDAPMDLQYVSDPSSEDNTSSSHQDLQSPGSSQTPIFGLNWNMPFLFEKPRAQSPQPYPWAPPPSFSPSKAFPQPKPEERPLPGRRVVGLGAMKRVYNLRYKFSVSRSSTRTLSQVHGQADSKQESKAEVGPIVQNIYHYYTVNVLPHQGPKSDMLFVFLGFLFKLSLILLFLYLIIQFVLTVQRDVERRVSEYSMVIVQEISMCSLQYKSNLCSSTAIPVMAQQCADWETCINQDPTSVQRAKVVAELIAEDINALIEPISWKTLTSLLFLAPFIKALSFYRSRQQRSDSTPAHHPSLPAGLFTLAPAASNTSQGSNGASEDRPSRKRRLEGGGVTQIA